MGELFTQSKESYNDRSRLCMRSYRVSNKPKTAEKFIGMTGHCPSCGKELEIVWQVQASLSLHGSSTVKVTR